MIAPQAGPALDLVTSPVLLPSHPHDEVEIEILEENLIEETRLLAGVGVILLANSLCGACLCCNE